MYTCVNDLYTCVNDVNTYANDLYTCVNDVYRCVRCVRISLRGHVPPLVSWSVCDAFFQLDETVIFTYSDGVACVASTGNIESFYLYKKPYTSASLSVSWSVHNVKLEPVFLYARKEGFSSPEYWVKLHLYRKVRLLPKDCWHVRPSVRELS